MKTIKQLTTIAANKINLPADYVWKVYQAYWSEVRKIIEELPLKENLTEEEWDNLKTSVNIPSLGKFYVNKEKVKNKKERYEIYKNKQNTTAIYNSTNNS